MRMVERNLLVYRHGWLMILSGFFEPLFYLLGIGFGLGTLVGAVPGPNGVPVPYPVFVAPALLAASSMNGAITESTFNFFFKLNYDKTFASILTTPMSPGDISIGELCWALIRGALYTLGFLAVMLLLGLAQSPLVIFTIPGALLIGFAFASVGMAATSFMRTWQDFDLIQLVVLPMFLFSGTFFPIDAYPAALRILIQITPLYRGVDLLRSLSLGVVGPSIVVDIVYLSVMGALGLLVVSRRLDKLLLR
jgi:lipooligosaccharide transport system permease protein